MLGGPKHSPPYFIRGLASFYAVKKGRQMKDSLLINKCQTDTITVYRVEHSETGYGPFYFKHNVGYALSYIKDPAEFKDAPKFKDMRYTNSHYFGWQTLWQAREFIRDFYVIKEKGFIIVKIVIENKDTILYPDGQIAFFLKNIVSKEVITWDRLHDELLEVMCERG